MIIVSQGKDEIVNFDRIESIWICPDEEGRITIEATANTNATLGTYATEERAKEVLQEIIKSINDSDVKIYSGRASLDITSQIKTIYYMPEK